MSEISLRDYFAKLEQLINSNAADEVIHHCRHILQYYPKNVTAYRYLGRALLLNGRWDEANAALRRVLSVIPDDYAAHLGLSEVYDYKKKADDAIWHLERAFEQNPNNSQLLDGIRALYRRHRNVDQAKVQLTAAAVARQALRNQQYEHAIDTLRDALERQPDRIDLRLLLAVALWESGDHVESAETALDVLQVLPDCLEANRILTRLWLEEDRPSDAQRYLNRVEAIDPYIAVEVAQGQPAPDDAFRLEELDYVRSAQSELTVNRPDWLKDITAEVPQVDAGNEDWSNFASSMLASSANAQAQEEKEKEPVDLFGDDATSVVETPASPSAAEDEEIPAEFAALTSGSSDDATTLTPTPNPVSDPNDPMAWLHGSGVELVDDLPSPFEEAQQSLAEDSSDALSWLQEEPSMEEAVAPSRPMPDSEAFSWMQDYDLDIPDASTASASQPEEPAVEEEMPDWLKDEGFLDEALGIEQLTGNDAPAEPDWLNFSESTKETTSLPEIIPPEMRPTSPIRDSVQKGDDLLVDTDWLKDISQDEPQPVPGPRRGLTAMLGEANFDWLKEQPAENDLTSDAVMDEWLAQFGASEQKSEPPPVEHAPDWLTELDTAMPDQPQQPASSEEPPDWLSGVGDAEPAKPSEPEDEFNWMQDDSEPASAETPDWLSEFQPAAAGTSESEVDQPESSDAFDWSTAKAVEDAETSDMPDWMAELEPTSTYESPSTTTFEHESSGQESEFEWLSEENATSQPSFENAEISASETEFELDLDPSDLPAEVPDWLSELQPQPQSSEASIEDQASDELSAVSGDAPDWLTEFQQPQQEDESEPAATSVTSDEQALVGEVPDWLSELNLQPEAQSEAEPVASSSSTDESWLSDQPDWLSELQSPAETHPVSDSVASNADDDSWLNETPAEDTEQPAVAADVPDWLSELQPQSQAETQPEAEPVASLADDDSWLDETPAEDAEQPAVAADVPDWLSELQPQSQAETEPEAEPVASLADDDSWLDETPAEDTEQPAVAADVPDWLSELQPQSQAETEAEPVSAATTLDDASWLNEEQVTDEASEEQPAVAADVPDWLSDLQSQAEAQSEAEPVASLADDDSWLDETPAEDAEQPAVAADVPDWLSELQPQSQAETEPEAEPATAASADASDLEVEPVTAQEDSSSDFSWSDDVEATEESDDSEFQPIRKIATDELEAVPAVSLADEADDEDDYWLNDEQAELETTNGEPQAEDDITEFEGLTVFPSDEMDVMQDETFEPAPASNAPDWLNAMVPGLDVDFEAAEDEPLETEFESEPVMRQSREFDWLEEIVEEESRQPETTVAVAEPAQPRYVFSRPPSWMNEPTGPVKNDEELPDWPSDVPEWLR